MLKNKYKILDNNQIIKFDVLFVVIFLVFSIWNFKLPVAYAGVIISAPSLLGLTNGLVGHWTFDGKDISGTTALDKSGSANHGTIFGAIKTIGKLNQALDFKRSQYVSAGTTGLSASSGTVSLWFKAKSWPAGSDFGYIYNEADNGNRIYLYLRSDGTLRVGLGDNNGVGNSSALSLDNWYLGTLIWDNGMWSLYIDGVYSTGGSYTGLSSIGASQNIGNNNLLESHDGFIDDVRLYNKALSASEIKRLYNTGTGAKMSTSKPIQDWVCGAGTVTDADNNTYPTVRIGNQCWMKENLRTTKKPDGSALTRVCYDDNETKCASPWGGLYTWTTAMNGSAAATGVGAKIQGICPTGWHIPSHYQANASDDFRTLTSFAGGLSTGGKHLKEIGTAHWGSSPSGTDNSSGFSAVGSGGWPFGTNFIRTWYAYFWSSFEANASNAFSLELYDSASYISDASIGKNSIGLSVRCIRDSVGAIPTDSLTSGLVGHWTFDNTKISGTSAIDSSGNGNNGTIIDATKIIGKLGQGLNFGNGADSVTFPSFDPENNNSVTIRALVKVDSFAGSSGEDVIFRFNAGDAPLLNLISSSNQTIRFELTTSGGVRQTFSPAVLKTGQWYDIVATYDGITQKVYVDGVLSGSDIRNESFSYSAVQSYIGCFTGSWCWYGSVDDVRIYSRAITANEVKRLYNQSVATKVGVSIASDSLSNGLVGHWTFDGKDIYGTTAIDKSGLGNNGTLVNGPTKIIGKLGQGLNFNGVNNIVTTSNEFLLNNATAITLSAWVKPTLTGSDDYQRIISKEGNYWFYVDSTGKLGASLVLIGGGNQEWYQGEFNQTLTANVWQHVTLVWDSTTSKVNVYKNGVAGTQQNTSGTSIYNDSTYYVRIGDRFENDRSFSGSIDDVRIYSRVLSATEIKKLYNMGK